jgi:hypothetical protein
MSLLGAEGLDGVTMPWGIQVHAERARREKDNRRLVKDMSRWLESAVSTPASLPTPPPARPPLEPEPTSGDEGEDPAGSRECGIA